MAHEIRYKRCDTEGCFRSTRLGQQFCRPCMTGEATPLLSVREKATEAYFKGNFRDAVKIAKRMRNGDAQHKENIRKIERWYQYALSPSMFRQMGMTEPELRTEANTALRMLLKIGERTDV